MAIAKNDLSMMNDLLSKGKTIADLAKKFPNYEYSEIYWEVSTSSILGKKRSITNRLVKLITTKTQSERQVLSEEAQDLLNELYEQLKFNSAKLVSIDRVLRKRE